ncbi:MAG: Calx-beta domain-containing protein, partial [Gammaproteobacteria bacterium]
TVVDDYSSVSGSLNWGIGQGGERSFTIPIHDDILIEGNETVALRLSNAAGGATLGRSVADLNIVDTETIGDIQFTTTNYSVDETGGNATISVERINGNSGSVSVDYATADGVGTATNGADYTTTSGTLTWPAGSSSVMTFTIPISADDLVEGDETVALRLSNATGGATLGRNVADLTIRDIVSIGEIQFQSVSYSVNENGGSATISVERVNGVTGAVSVDYATADVPGGATAGSDYQATSGGLSWKAGEGGTKTFTVSITDDALVENNETLDLLLSKPTGGAVLGAQSSARLTITDNDRQQVNPGVLEFDVVEVSVDEDAGTVSLTVNRLNGSDGAISVDYVTGDQTATAGGDYSTATGTLEWADGDSRSKQISIPILADSAIENDETFELQLSNTTGGATIGALNPATITILDSQGGNADTSPQAISAMSIEKVSGADQNATSGQLLPFVIKVWDANANPSVGEAVTWTVTPAGAGTLSNDASTTTGADGQSSNTFTVNQNRIIKITATAQQGTAVFVVNSLAGKAGLSSNQRSAGRALDAACPTLADITSPTSDQQDMLNVCESLNTASDSDIATALTQMAHDDLASQGSMMVEYSLGQLSQIDVRMAELRGGATGINLSGLSFDVLGQPIPNIVFASLWETAQGGGASADEPPGMPSRWGGFINGNISVGDKDPTTNEPGFDLKANGITLGADYRLSNDMIVGGAIGFISSKSDLNASAGDQEVDGISLSAYGTFYQSESIYIDGILSLGQNDFTSRRNMTFGTLNQTAVGDTSGNEIAISIGGGYDMNRDALSFGPYGRIDYVNVDIDGFDEKPSNPGGAGSGLMLSVDSQSVEMMTAMVGGQMIYTYSTAIGVIAPQLKLEWAHEFMDDSRIINAHFANDPTISTFGITTDDPDRDYFNLGLGVTGTFANGKSAYLMYETVLDRDHVNVYSIAFGGRMEF